MSVAPHAKNGGRYRTWRFNQFLHTSLLPQASIGLAPSNTMDPTDIILKLFQDMFLTQEKPASVTYIHLRVSRAAFDHCVSCGKAQTQLPDLPFTGYLQANDTIDRQRLTKWLDMTWDAVGEQLRSHGPYRADYLEPSHATAAAFVYFCVHGTAAVQRAGRKPKGGGPPTDSAVNHCPASTRRFPMLHGTTSCGFFSAPARPLPQ